MNLHEECLLKYLLNPTGLSSNADFIRYSNDLIKRGMIKSVNFDKKVVK